MKLDDTQRDQLARHLRDGPGPVNLTATASRFGISRPTLHSYIDAEPGLREAIEARRKANGRGYEQVERGTRATRRAAKKRSVAKLVEAVRPRDPLPIGLAAKLMAGLWSRLAADHRQQLRDWDDMVTDDPAHAANHARDRMAVLAHQRQAEAHAKVFKALADGSMQREEAQAVLDALPKPPPLYVPDPRYTAALEAERQKQADHREKIALEFKGKFGYRPSARQLDKMTGKPGRSFTKEEWAEEEQRRDMARVLRQAREKAQPRKSYPSRPKDAQGRPLVARGVMAKLQREAEARGLTGQAAKDAAIAAALASLTTDGARSGSVVNPAEEKSDE